MKEDGKSAHTHTQTHLHKTKSYFNWTLADNGNNNDEKTTKERIIYAKQIT